MRNSHYLMVEAHHIGIRAANSFGIPFVFYISAFPFVSALTFYMHFNVQMFVEFLMLLGMS